MPCSRTSKALELPLVTLVDLVLVILCENCSPQEGDTVSQINRSEPCFASSVAREGEAKASLFSLVPLTFSQRTTSATAQHLSSTQALPPAPPS